MSGFGSFSDNISLADLPRIASTPASDGDISVFHVSDERIERTNQAKRMVLGPASLATNYYTTFEAKQRMVREVFVARFSRPFVYGKKFYIFDRNKSLLLESIPPALRKTPSSLREEKEANSVKINVIDQDVIVCGVHNYENYFHWHVDCLPGILQAERSGVKGKVLTPPANSWRSASLSYMGIKPENIICANDMILNPSAAYWPSSLARRGFHMGDDVVEAFDRIQRGVQRAGRMSSSSFEKVYIGRTDTTVRKLLNEAELIGKLESLGYKILIPGLFQYEEQISIIAKARVVVGLHGAGLTNIGFAPPNCNVVEIFPETYLNNGYLGMAQVTQQNYYAYSRNNLTGENTRFGQPDHWRIDIEDFVTSYADVI